MRFRNGLEVGLSWTNERRAGKRISAVLASHFPPNSLQWRWALYWTRPYSLRDAFRLPRVGPGMDRGRRYRVGGHFSGWLRLPFVGSLALRTQPSIPAKGRRHERP